MENEKFIGFGKRLGAFMIDAIIIFVVWQFLMGLLFGLGLRGEETIGKVVVIVYSLIYFSYFIFLESSKKQATLGKRIFKIKVVNHEGERLSIANSAGRNFGRILSGLILGIGYLMVLFTPKKQALHDKLAKTYVVGK
ncbi:RDD family protein [Sulfurimonas microaerophilic]|uniref:RDD family protein n=1 Tax=Sulfurimonas microaerophilic TaxID=3058392 RepID=UPI00271538A9|nr:RDD family protein [Sulfurimonas sp. hsl 1-7]